MDIVFYLVCESKNAWAVRLCLVITEPLGHMRCIPDVPCPVLNTCPAFDARLKILERANRLAVQGVIQHILQRIG